jgi:Mrp family chromosome partitioning ATPase
VLALALSAAALAAVVTLRQPTISYSSVTMVVQTSGGANDTETLVRTMIALVESDVLGEALREEVASPLTASEITAGLIVDRPPGSSVLTVYYGDTDAQRSIDTAGVLIPVFQDQVSALEAGQAGGLAPNYAIQPWGGGAVITSEEPAPVLRNALIAALLGLALGSIGAVLYQQRHALVFDVAGAEEATGLPVVTLPGPVGGDRKNAQLHPADVMASLAGSLPAALGTVGVPRRILIVSADSGRQRTAFAVQFARSLAQGDSPVVLVDANLESGRLTRHLGLSKVEGLAECLHGELEPAEALVLVEDGPAAGLAVLPVGLGLPVRSGSAVHVLSHLDANARVVIDGPEPSRHQSVGGLLRSVDAVLVVVTLRSTTVTDASQITSLVTSLADVPAATVVLSDRPERPSSRLAARSLVPTEPSRAATLPA